MDILHPQLRPLLPMLEPWHPRVHDPHRIQIFPELAVVAPILVADKLHQISLQEILPVHNLRMVEIQLQSVPRDDALVPWLAWDEGFGGDIVGEEFCIDGVEDAGHEGCHERRGGAESSTIVGGKGKEGFQVRDARRERI